MYIYIYHIGSKVLFNNLDDFGMAWEHFSNVDLSRRWRLMQMLSADNLNWNLSLILSSCSEYFASFSETWRFHPPSKGGSTWDTTSSSIDWYCMICDVSLNIRMDTLQTYSVLKIVLVVWRTWMVSFLSSWVTTGDTGTIGYILASSVFLTDN